jgi:hypothetical protein
MTLGRWRGDQILLLVRGPGLMQLDANTVQEHLSDVAWSMLVGVGESFTFARVGD